MASRRFKSGPYVRRRFLAFREFGAITPYITGYKRLIWHYQDGPPTEVFAPSIELMEHHREVLVMGDLDAYESYCRSGPAQAGPLEDSASAFGEEDGIAR